MEFLPSSAKPPNVTSRKRLHTQKHTLTLSPVAAVAYIQSRFTLNLYTVVLLNQRDNLEPNSHEQILRVDRVSFPSVISYFFFHEVKES